MRGYGRFGTNFRNFGYDLSFYERDLVPFSHEFSSCYGLYGGS